MQIALNDVLKDDGKILRVDADFGPDTFEMKLGSIRLPERLRFHWFSRTKESGIC